MKKNLDLKKIQAKQCDQCVQLLDALKKEQRKRHMTFVIGSRMALKKAQKKS